MHFVARSVQHKLFLASRAPPAGPDGLHMPLSAADCAAVVGSLDVEQAECYNPGDKQMILAVCGLGFGVCGGGQRVWGKGETGSNRNPKYSRAKPCIIAPCTHSHHMLSTACAPGRERRR